MTSMPTTSQVIQGALRTLLRAIPIAKPSTPSVPFGNITVAAHLPYNPLDHQGLRPPGLCACGQGAPGSQKIKPIIFAPAVSHINNSSGSEFTRSALPSNLPTIGGYDTHTAFPIPRGPKGGSGFPESVSTSGLFRFICKAKATAK